MKVGDIYEKDGKKYEVLQILGLNCWSSKEVEAEDVPVLEEAPVIVEKKPRGRRKKAE